MNLLSRTAIFTLYAIYALDLMGLVFVYVIIPPLIITPESPMVASTLPLNARNLVVGILVATYPFAQFFAAPTLGDLSDRFGRRKILLISTLGTALMFCLSGLSILVRSITLLFISRFLSGIFAGNLTIAQASMGEGIHETKRGQYMAAFSLVGGVAWTAGPFVAALLSDHKLLPFFHYSTPFWFLGIVLFIATLLLFSIPKSSPPEPGQKLDLHKVAINLLEPFKIPNVTRPFMAAIITMFGWMMYQGYLAPYLIEKFHFSEQWEGYAYAISSFGWLIGGLIATCWILKYYSPIKSATLPLIVAGLAVFGYLFAYKAAFVWVLLSVANPMQAIATSCFFGMFALLVPGNHQGKIFGAWNAGFALASALGPAIAGWLVNFRIYLPFLVASIILIITALYYWRWQVTTGEKT